MEHRQNFCRGAVVLCSGKPSLIIAVSEAGAVVVPLRSAGLPRYRSDVTVALLMGACLMTARCAEPTYEIFARLNPLNETSYVRFGAKDMARVDAAIRREIVSRAGEQLPPGVVKSTFRPIFGSRGRKVGGPPSD